VLPEQATGPFLKGPGSQNIPCWRERRIVVSFAGRRYEWDFVLAKVDFAIVGADFFQHFGLVWTCLQDGCLMPQPCTSIRLCQRQRVPLE
jgi:hypothetical protein